MEKEPKNEFQRTCLIALRWFEQLREAEIPAYRKQTTANIMTLLRAMAGEE